MSSFRKQAVRLQLHSISAANIGKLACLADANGPTDSCELQVHLFKVVLTSSSCEINPCRGAFNRLKQYRAPQGDLKGIAGLRDLSIDRCGSPVDHSGWE